MKATEQCFWFPLIQSIMSCKVARTFESVDEILNAFNICGTVDLYFRIQGLNLLTFINQTSMLVLG